MELEKNKNTDFIINKPVNEMEQGDVLNDELLIRWQCVATIPKLVAETWFGELYTDTPMNDNKTTPNEQKMEYWQEGYGVVVGKVTVYPGYYKLNLLHKGLNGFSLQLTRDIFPEPK